MRWIRNIILIGIVVAVAYWLVGRYRQLPSFASLFAAKPVLIQNTPVVVKQIQAIAELVTISAYQEMVADTLVTNTKTIHLPLLPDIKLAGTPRKLVIIGKSTVHIGIDMQQLRDNDISGTQDSIHIVLPAAQVLDAIINPSDVEVFIEQGSWDNLAVANLKNRIRYLAVSDAMSRGLLAQSEKKAVEVLTHFFNAAGYEQVVIQFRGNRIQMQ